MHIGHNLAVLLLLVCVQGHAASLLLTTELSSRAQMMVNGQLVGRSVDKVKMMMHRAGIEYEIQLLPWARAYQTALIAESQACVFSTTRTPERESNFKWVGPLVHSSWQLYARKSSQITLKTIEDARSYVIGTYNGDVRDAWLKERGFHVDTASTDDVNPLKLTAGHIDLWADGEGTAKTLIKKHQLTGQIKPVLSFQQTSLYLACNPAVADSAIASLQKAFDEMEKDGSNAIIDKRYDDMPE